MGRDKGYQVDTEPEIEEIFQGDENKQRGNWGGQLEFLLSCLGYAVGLGNVWRFPYLAYKNGGALFLIPYAIMLFLVGVPIFVLELSLGQFTSCGPVTCWKFSRLFSGLGWGMVVVSMLVGIYYNMVIGWAIYYLIASFFKIRTGELPWEDCIPGVGKSSPYCSGWLMSNLTCSGSDFNPTTNSNVSRVMETNGVCTGYNIKSGMDVLGFWNSTIAEVNKKKAIVPSESYLYYVVWGRGNYPQGLSEGLGALKWELALCLLGAWIMIYAALVKGIKSSGKVVYFTAIFPYVMLIVLLIRGVLLDGHLDGVKFYMTADVSRLNDAGVWKDAAVQIFFSLSASWGGLIALSSYNKFHNDCIRDSLIVAFGNCMTSFFAGFVIFSYLGFLAKEAGQNVEDVVASGTGLAFVVYTRAVASIPAAPLWSVLFFLMLLTLGLDSEFALVETLLTSYMDLFPTQRNRKWLVLLVMCIVMYLLGLTMCCEAGSYLLDILDTYSGGWNVLLIALLECVAVAYTYGVCRFIKDIEVMISGTTCFPAWYCYKYWWAACWCFFTPVAVTFVMVFSWLGYEGIKNDDGTYMETRWEALGWLCTMVVVLAIFVPPIYHFIVIPGGCSEKWAGLLNPTVDWGPALVEHRELVDYVDGWVVDPKGNNATQYPNQAYVSDDKE